MMAFTLDFIDYSVKLPIDSFQEGMIYLFYFLCGRESASLTNS